MNFSFDAINKNVNFPIISSNYKDSLSGQTLSNNIHIAQHHHVPYYALVAVENKQHQVEFFDAIYYYKLALKQDPQDRAKVHYFVLPLFNFDSHQVSSPINFTEENRESLIFHRLNVEKIPAKFTNIFLDSINFHILMGQDEADKKHVRKAQKAISANIENGTLDCAVFGNPKSSNVKIERQEEALKWLFCAASEDLDIQTELVMHCLQGKLHEPARAIFSKLQQIPRDELSREARSRLQTAEAILSQQQQNSQDPNKNT